MKIKKFKNGNINVKKEFNSDENLLHALLNDYTLDFTIVGDEGCAGNYDMYYPLYNTNNDLLYLILGSDCSKFEEGKTVKLVGRELTKDEKIELEEQGIL